MNFKLKRDNLIKNKYLKYSKKELISILIKFNKPFYSNCSKDELIDQIIEISNFYKETKDEIFKEKNINLIKKNYKILF